MATPEETAQLAAAAKLAEEGQEKLNAAIDSYNQKLQRANDLKRESQTIEEARLEKEQQIAEQRQKINDAINLQVELNEKLIEQQKISGKASERKQRLFQMRISAQEKNVELAKQQTEALIEQSEVFGQVLEDQKKYGKEVEKNLRLAETSANELGAVFARFASEIPVIGSSLAKVFDQKKNIAKLGKQLIQLGADSGRLGLSILGKGLTKFASAITLSSGAVTLFLGAIGRFALQFDNLSKEIGRTTGLGDKFRDTILQGYKATMLSGVSIQEYGNAVTALANNFSGFNLTSRETNNVLSNTIARLEKLGVSSETSVKIMDHFHRAMNVSKEAAADMTAQLVMMGREVGITTSKMASNFEASAGIIARYGRDQVKVLKHLAAQVKATGLEMGTLLGMAEKFDQFDTAAESAAQLNAVLGTQLSTLELMNANEAERIDMIKQSVQASVGNFDSLDKFTKMYVAQAMGVKDVAEAQRVLNMSMAERNALAAKQQEQADIQAELAEATARLVPMMDRLKIIGMKLFMVFEPLIGAFDMLFTGLDKLYGLLTQFLPAMDGMGTVMTILKVVGVTIGAIMLPISGTAAAIVGLVSALGGLWNIIHKKGSLDMANGLMSETIGKSISSMGVDAKGAAGDLDSLNGKMGELYDTTHKGKDNSFDVQGMASLDTTAIAAGFNKIKSAVMELSNIKMDGFLALKTTGDETSFVMGSQAMETAMLISGGKLTVDVRMPKMEMPEFNIKVFLSGEEMKQIAKAEVTRAEANRG